MTFRMNKLCQIDHVHLGIFPLKQEEGTPITANSLHPGSVVTNLMREGSFVNGMYYISKITLISDSNMFVRRVMRVVQQLMMCLAYV